MSSPPPLSVSGAALFLDLDGTVIPIAPRPDDVRADAEVLRLLAALQAELSGRLAVVSGRTVADVDRILEGAVTCIAGVHGLERRRAEGTVEAAAAPASLAEAQQAFECFAAERPGVIVEEKGLAVGLHYRLAPAEGAEANRLGGELAGRLDLWGQPGSMVYELRAPGAGKDAALKAFMQEPPFRGSTPVFVGDDLTDEDGFAAAGALGGYGVIVGSRTPTAARWRLRDVAEVRRWLGAAVGEGARG